MIISLRIALLYLAFFIQVQGFIPCFHQQTMKFSTCQKIIRPKPLIKLNGLYTDIPFQNPDHDLLIRVAKGNVGERTPVWLMRQAGRYMSSFRQYSDVIPFRERCETPEIAVELSLQCWKSFGMDGVIMFSDILTPLTSMGIEFDVIKGQGPVIFNPIKNENDVQNMLLVKDYDSSLPFIKDILKQLSLETKGKVSLIGFVGSPLTLASYLINGHASKDCKNAKILMYNDENVVKELLEKLAINIANYACHQISCGAQIIQFFDSWAHHFTPSLFEKYAKVYANKAMSMIKEKYPEVPIIYFANGGSSYLHLQKDMNCDVIGLDQGASLSHARNELSHSISNTGLHKKSPYQIQGNIDPVMLFSSEEKIRQEVRNQIHAAGGPGRHILNLGHGVLQETPERSVGCLVDEAKKIFK